MRQKMATRKIKILVAKLGLDVTEKEVQDRILAYPAFQFQGRFDPERYEWLLRQNGLTVSDTGYFVYANGATDREAFDAQLEFDLTLIAYEGHDDWVGSTLEEIHGCLNKNHIPAASRNCDYCRYRSAVDDVTA